MKITSAQADPDALPHGLKNVQVRATRWGVVIQAKPRKGNRSWSPLQKQQRIRFGLAARMASDPHSLDLRTAMEMAKGTQQVPRDILTMAAQGRYYFIANPDGTAWRTTERPFSDDPLTIRPPSLKFASTKWPPEPDYITIGDGWRLKL